MFAHLRVHSAYSIFDGMAGIKALFEKAEALGQPGLALTDHGYLHGIPEFLAESGNHPSVKPVIGCEIYITDGYDHTVKGPDHRRTFHLILVAKNLTGYRNLVKICSEGAIVDIDEHFQQ